MRKCIVAITLFFIPFLCSAQVVFEKAFYGTNPCESNNGGDVIQTFDSGYALNGIVTDSFSNPKMFLLKLNVVGDTVWSNTYNCWYGMSGYSFKQTPDSGYIIIGQDNYYKKMQLIKTDATGDTIWTKEISVGSLGRQCHVEVTSDDGYLISGQALFNTNLIGEYMYFIKTNLSGDTIWSRLIGNNLYGTGCYMSKETYDRGFLICGTVQNPNPSYTDIYLVRTDSIGDTLWTKYYGSKGFESFSHICLTQDSGFIVSAFVTDSIGGTLIIKGDQNGDTIWTKFYKNSVATKISNTNDGGFVMTGADSCGAFIFKIDANGNPLWNKTYNPEFSSSGYSVTQCSDGGFIMAGHEGGACGYVYLVKTDSLGNSLCSSTCNPMIGTHPQVFVGNNLQIVQHQAGWLTHNNISLVRGFLEINPCQLSGISSMKANDVKDLIIYPNPVNNIFTITNSEQYLETLEVMTLMGQTLKIQKHLYKSKEITCDVTDLPPGIYLLKISFDQDCIFRKIVKE